MGSREGGGHFAVKICWISTSFNKIIIHCYFRKTLGKVSGESMDLTSYILYEDTSMKFDWVERPQQTF